MNMPVVKYRPSVAPVMEHLEGENAFMLSNVRDTNALKISSKSGEKKNQLDFALLKDTEKDNHYKVEYKPGDKQHIVKVKYGGQHIAGSPFQLEPDFSLHMDQQQPQLLERQAEAMQSDIVQQQQQQQDVQADLDPSSHVVTVSNVPDFEKFTIDTPMAYSIFPGDKEQEYKVAYEPAAGIHDLKVHYDQQLVDSFRLVPESMKNEFLNTMKAQPTIEESPVDQGKPTKPCPPGEPCPGPKNSMPNAMALEPMSDHVNRGRLLMTQNMEAVQQQQQVQQSVIDTGLQEYKTGRMVYEQPETASGTNAQQSPLQMNGSAPRFIRQRG